MRSSFVYEYVQEAVEMLEAKAAEEADANSTSTQILRDELHKRRRVQ